MKLFEDCVFTVRVLLTHFHLVMYKKEGYSWCVCVILYERERERECVCVCVLGDQEMSAASCVDTWFLTRCIILILLRCVVLYTFSLVVDIVVFIVQVIFVILLFDRSRQLS